MGQPPGQAAIERIGALRSNSDTGQTVSNMGEMATAKAPKAGAATTVTRS
jgi:hypothetical protein